MPSSNGVYSLPSGYLAVTGATIQASQHNPPLEDIAAALTARLSRDGTAAMTGSIQLAPGSVTFTSAREESNSEQAAPFTRARRFYIVQASSTAMYAVQTKVLSKRTIAQDPARHT